MLNHCGRVRTNDVVFHGLLVLRRTNPCCLRIIMPNPGVTRISIVVLSLSVVFLFRSSIAAEGQVAEVLDKAIEAIGGSETLAKFKAACWETNEKSYGPDGTGTFAAEYARQGSEQFHRSMKFALDDGRVTNALVINGAEGWVRNRLGAVVAITERTSLAEAKTNSIYLSWITTLIPLKGKEFKLSSGGELKLGDRVASCLLISHDGYHDVLLCFDKETGLLARSERPIKVQSGSPQEIGKVLIEEKLYTDYQTTDGVRWARRIITKIDGKVRNETEVLEFKFHEKLDDAVFAKP